MFSRKRTQLSVIRGAGTTYTSRALCVPLFLYFCGCKVWKKSRIDSRDHQKNHQLWWWRAPIAWIDVNPTTTRSPWPRRSLVLFELVINEIHIEIMCIFYSVKALSYTTYKENVYIPKARIYSRSGWFNRLAKRGSLETNNHSPDLK